MNRKMLIIALAALIVLTAIVAVAQGRRANAPAAQPLSCAARCQQVLNLTADQIAARTRIQTALANDTASLRADLQAKMKQIAALWAAQEPNTDQIKQLAAQADQIRAEIRDKAIDARAAWLNELTPAQRATCIQNCQSGQCGCGMCGGCGMGMGMGCGAFGAAAGTGVCPMGAGRGYGMGMGQGRGCCGMGMGMGRGPAGAGCPLANK